MVYDSGLSGLSNSLSSKRQLAEIRENTFNAGDRLANGHKNNSDIAKDGKTSEIYAIDRELSVISRYQQAASLGSLRLEAVQAALENVRNTASDVSLGVLSALNEQSDQSITAQSAKANSALSTIVGTLNQSFAGNALFSGANLHSAALIDSSQIISDVEVIVSSAVDASTALSAVDFYFNDPSGGFSTTAYIGSAFDAPDIEVNSGELVGQNVRADNQSIKETIRNLSLIAAVSNGAVANSSDKTFILRAAADQSLNTNDSLIALQGDVGYSQAKLELASLTILTQSHTLKLARNEATAIDVFEEAAQFEELQVQLETSYNVLVRISSLSLSNFLR